jgi:4'-phosphopantetheinyl transferase
MSSLRVQAWPSAQQPQWNHNLLVLSVATPAGQDRAAARLAVRAAICEAACLLLDIGEERLEVSGTPGAAPRLLVDGSDCGIGVSISHESGVSLAVLHKNGAVGIDLMQVALASDWARVAHDYLGMAQATTLAASGEAGRPLAFCQAWTRREAAFKCRGEALREWRAGERDHAQLFDLQLDDGLVGAVAIGP